MMLDPYDFFLITGVVIPTLIALALVPLRWNLSKWVYPPTDFVVVLISIDLAIIFDAFLLDGSTYGFLSLGQDGWWLVVLFVFSVLVLVVSVKILEPLLTAVENEAGVMKNVPWLEFILTWTLGIALFYAHISTFQTKV